MTGRKSQRKGSREELAVKDAWQDHGFAAERVPRSGQGQDAGSKFFGDVTIPLLGHDRPFECKVKADGFRQLYQFIEGAYGLTVRADRKERLYVLRERDFLELAKAAEREK